MVAASNLFLFISFNKKNVFYKFWYCTCDFESSLLLQVYNGSTFVGNSYTIFRYRCFQFRLQ